MRQYIPDPENLLNDIWQDKDVYIYLIQVNIVQKEHKLGQNRFRLIDISINAHGQDEDKKYIQSSFYRANIRRGNTIIENLNRKNQIDWARKGTPKMLDIKLQYIRFFLKKFQLKKQQRNTAQIIFEGVNQAFRSGKRVQLIKTQKLNGQNAQVSYNYDIDAWVICSKNVSLIASSPKDIDRYSDSRYKYAGYIAQQWFKEIQHLGKQQIIELKKLLDGFTIVGQYCGNPLFQHLVKYERTAIVWFAMIDNYSQEYCLDPFRTKKQLQKYKFKTAKIKNILISGNPEQFYISLESLFLKTAQAGLQDQQFGREGSIVYFAVQQMKNKSATSAITVGGGKLKTLEYRYFRKIRQKISRYILKKENSLELVNKFINQITQLQEVTQSKTIFPREYYIKILKAALQLTEFSNLKDQQLRRNFINILKIIFYALHKKISLKKHGKNLLKDNNFIDKISEIPFMKYGGLGCSTKIIYMIIGLPGMFKSYLGKKIASHFEKIGIQYSILEYKEQNCEEKHIETLCKANKQSDSLEHFFLDGSFDSGQIMRLVNNVRKNGDKSCFYKFIAIEDSSKENRMFQCDDCNEYPFRLETIIMCYLGQHEKKRNSLTIQQKIDNLKIVTDKLKGYANLNTSLHKLDISRYRYPFSQKSKIGNVEQFEAILKTIISTQDDKILYNQYCLLIIRLQKIKGIEYLSQQGVDNEIKHLIQSSYPQIPMICFKNSADYL